LVRRRDGPICILSATASRIEWRVDRLGRTARPIECSNAADAELLGYGLTGHRGARRELGAASRDSNQHGSSNFVVRLLGYGSVTGDDLVFNEIGRYYGQTLGDDELPSGHT
jgi:hypothetical protein